jgi:uncharacterized membrane protein YdfJ with MMPL/SSD domain
VNRWASGVARGCAVHPCRTLMVWAVAFLASVVCASLGLAAALTTEDSLTTGVESKVGFDLLDRRLPDEDPLGGEVVVVRADTLVVTDPAFRRFVRRLAADIEGTGKTGPVRTAYTSRDRSTVSADRHATLLTVPLRGDHPEQAVRPVVDVVRRADADPGFAVGITGATTVGSDIRALAQKDLRTGELYFGLPAALVVLLLVFGAIVAAFVPLGLALMCIPVTTGVITVVGQVSELSVFVLNMVTAMGLALGIDYSLLILSRCREERRRGRDRVDAIAAAGGTAGVAVAFSGMAFAVALLGLLFVPDTVLRSLAAGAIIVGVVTVGGRAHPAAGGALPARRPSRRAAGARDRRGPLRRDSGGPALPAVRPRGHAPSGMVPGARRRVAAAVCHSRARPADRHPGGEHPSRPAGVETGVPPGAARLPGQRDKPGPGGRRR